MALGPVARLLIWLLSKCPSVNTIEVDAALDPEREADIELLEYCLHLPDDLIEQ